MKPLFAAALGRVFVSSMILGSVGAAPAQLTVWYGEADAEVFAPPADDSMRVRLLATNDYPLNPLCSWSGNSTGADGSTYEWRVGYLGDGLVGPHVNATVVTLCTVRHGGVELGSKRHVLNVYLPYPSEGFSVPVRLAASGRIPADGNGGDWSDTESGEWTLVPSLSFAGAVRLDEAGKLSLAIVFTGGEPPAPTIDELLQLVRQLNLAARDERLLIKQLEQARDARICARRANHLRVFQKKVRLLVSDSGLASVLTSDAQALIDSGCNERR